VTAVTDQATVVARDLYDAEMRARQSFPGGRHPTPWDRLDRDIRAAKVTAATEVLVAAGTVTDPVPPLQALFGCPRCLFEVVALASSRPTHRCPDAKGHPAGPEVDFRHLEDFR
jgi:hypothetical protein